MFQVACLAWLAFALVACAQGVGDSCQIDADCEDGLMCSITDDDSTSRGTCIVPGSMMLDGSSDDEDDDASAELYDDGGTFDDAGN